MSASRIAFTLIFLTLPWFIPTTAAQDAGRFRGMDSNRDGVITRSEWRGNAQSFRMHDWNNDGVLSGDEVRSAAQRNDRWQDEDFDPETSQQVTDWTARGFRDLDLNGDGRITRNEWPYDLATFRRVDRNNNNWIARAEYVGADVVDTPAGEFDYLDSNNNNRLEWSEWQGSRAEFNRLDRNRDGWVTRRELMATSDVAQTGSETRDVRVDPRERWTATGIYVRAGDLVTWQADGTIQMSTDTSDTATPAGSTKGRRASDAPVREALAGGLLMNVGGSVIRFAGPTGSSRASTSGELYLGVNDDHLLDNSGEYRVRITIGR